MICFFLTGCIGTPCPMYFSNYNFQEFIFFLLPCLGRYWSWSISLASCHCLTLMAVLSLMKQWLERSYLNLIFASGLSHFFQLEVLLGLSSSILFSYYLGSINICVQFSNTLRPGLLFPISSVGTSANSFLCSSLSYNTLLKTEGRWQGTRDGDSPFTSRETGRVGTWCAFSFITGFSFTSCFATVLQDSPGFWFVKYIFLLPTAWSLNQCHLF